jgi:hypothetical protein
MQPSQPDPVNDDRLEGRCSRLVEAINRWQEGIATGAIQIPGTMPSGIVHKTAASLEEIVAACVKVFLVLLDETDREKLGRQGRFGFGGSVRTLKQMIPLLEQKSPIAQKLVDAKTTELLDRLVSMRNDFMHRTLEEDDKKAVLAFIGAAKELCDSELIRVALGVQ